MRTISDPDSMKKTLIIGGTGFIGEILTKELIKSGYDVTLLIRKKNLNKVKKGEIRFLDGDLLDQNSLQKGVANFDLVINLASVIRTIHKRKYQENIIGLKNLIEIMEQNGVSKLVYFSTQKINARKKGYYASSKSEAEEIITKSRLRFLIIRPNYVYDLDKRNDFYRIAKVMRHFRIAPIIGRGKNRIQPILRTDLAYLSTRQINKFVNNNNLDNKIVEISGKETLSISEIICLIGEELKIRYIKINIPEWILLFFKRIISFDIDCFTEDMVSDTADAPEQGNFKENIKKITRALL